MADIFDSSLNLEEQFIEEGRKEGIRQGRLQGYRDGVNLGVDKGFEIGSELGFYRGALKTWTALQREQPGFFTERIERLFALLQELIQNFPKDPQDERLQDALADLRGKFTATVVMMGARDTYFPKDEQGASSSMAF